MNEEANNNEKTTRMFNRQYPSCVHRYQVSCYCQTEKKTLDHTLTIRFTKERVDLYKKKIKERKVNC